MRRLHILSLVAIAMIFSPLRAESASSRPKRATGISPNRVPKVSTTKLHASQALGMALNNTVNVADFAMIGRIMSVTPPRYNSVDGKIYVPDDGVPPFYFRIVRVRIDQVAFGNIAIGDELQFFFAGSGVNDGEPVAAFDNLHSERTTDPVRRNSVVGWCLSPSAVKLLFRSLFRWMGTNR